MGAWTTLSPWKVIAGSGQSLSVSNGSSATFTNKVGSQTYAIAISLAPTATATSANVKISQAGTAASATQDIQIKTTDPPLILGCNPGDKVSVWGLGAASTAYLTELTH